jgi:DNA invertase Pin-like site-specific DNA recombinase
MEEKITAIYVMVRKTELKPEDGGSYEGPLAKQKEECLDFLKKKVGETDKVHVYTSRSDLFTDIERDLIGKVVVYSLDRLGSTKEDLDACLFELEVRKVEVVSVT